MNDQKLLKPELVNYQIADMLENMSESFFSLDKNLCFIYINKAAERSINLAREQVIGKCILEIYPTETPNEWQLAYEKVLRDQEPFHGELFDAFSRRWYQVSLCPSLHGGITGYYNDITDKIEREAERQRLLAELETANQSLEAILKQLPAGVLVVHPSGGIIRANNEAARICEFSDEPASLKTEDWQGRILHLDGTMLEINEYPLFRVVKKGEVVRNEEYIIRKDDGTEVIINTNASPIVNNDKSIKAGIVTFTDITERKQMEQKIARLDRMNMIGEMAASIGHEIRNPLTTVRGFLQMFQAKKDLAGYGEYLEIMIEEIDRANSIITEFLSLAKNKKIDLASNNLNVIISKIYPLIQADAVKEGKTVTLELGDIPNLLLDENEIRQCVLNLVRNGLEAIKPKGTVRIKTCMIEDCAMLEIKDNGQGISQEVLGKLGTPFITTKDNGTGLGIPICYKIVERHKAQLDIQTGSNGTTFSIKFK